MEKNKVIKFLISFLFVVIISYIIAFLYNNYRLLRNYKELGVKTVNFKQISYNDFKIKGNKLISIGEEPTITINYKDFSYINDLKFDYKIANNSSWHLSYTTYNGYGRENGVELENSLNKNINIFSETFKKKVKSVTIKFENEKIEIENIRRDNRIKYITLNYFYFILIGVALFLLYYFKKNIKEHVEYLFLILSLTSGLIIIITNPVGIGKSWDDQIHLVNMYSIFHKSYSESIYQLSDNEVNVLKNGFATFNNDEEKIEFINYLNSVNYDNNIKIHNNFSFNKVTYLPQSIMYSLCELLKLSFSTTIVLCLIVGLLFYSLIVFFAIRRTPIAKYLMLVLSLIPSTLFMASNFSYDPPITSLIMLGISYFLYEKYNNDGKLCFKNALIIIICIVLASCPKAVYAPLILLLLMLPKEKFVSKKSERIFKISILVIMILLMSTFVLPVLTNNMAGDARGGDTSVSEQLKLIILTPVSFSKVFYNNAIKQFMYKFFSKGTFLSFAYFGLEDSENSYYIFMFLIIIATLMISNENKKLFSKKEKVIILLILFAIIGEIWLSLYLSFTPVGSETINGVQNRYFIPLLLPLLLLLKSDKIKVNLSTEVLYKIFSIGLILVTSMYLTVFI